MKLMIASDLHGSAAYTRRLLELYRDTGTPAAASLGDLTVPRPTKPAAGGL